MSVFIPAPTAFSTTPSYQSNPFVSGFNQVVTSSTTFTISPGCARALCNEAVIQYPSYSLNQPGVITVDITTVGINGCFPRSLDSLILSFDTTFPVYICENQTGASNSVGVVVATDDNFLPPGYTLYRRIGWIYINASPKIIIRWVQSGAANDKVYNLDIGIPCIANGHDTSYTAVDLTALQGIIPPRKSTEVIFNLALAATVANQFMRLAPFAANASLGVPVLAVISPAVGTVGSNAKMIATPNSLGNAAIQYIVSNAAATANVAVTGFTDSLDNSLV